MGKITRFWKPKFLATGIGSMPYTDWDYAIRMVLEHFPEVPFWPQLPRRDLREQMEIQYSEGMPGAVIDSDRKRLFFRTRIDQSLALAKFYEDYLGILESGAAEESWSWIGISPEFARGLYALEQHLKKQGEKQRFVKVQTTGPLSFTLAVTDEEGRAIFYQEQFRDMAVKALGLKCRWQIRKFRPYAEQVICFIDEPILSAFGSSAYLGVHRQEVIAMLREVKEAIHAEQGLAGVHCCGNTDWSILTDVEIDIISFDAFNYGETIALYPEAIKRFIEGGGIIAWGIVPTSAEVRKLTAAFLRERAERAMDNLASRGINKSFIAEQSMLTPSCGAGSLSPDDAKKAFALTRELSRVLRSEYGFE